MAPHSLNPRLLVLTECYPRPRAIRHCAFAHSQMVGLSRADWDVIVFRPRGWHPPLLWRVAPAWREAHDDRIPARWSIDGVSVTDLVYQNRVPSRLNAPIDTASRIAEAMRRRVGALGARAGRDVLLVHFALPYGPVARAVSEATGIPYVVFLRGDDVWVWPHRGAHRLEAFKRALGGASLVLGVSRSLLDEAGRLVGTQLPPAAVVPNGVALDRFRPPASDGERERGRATLGVAPGETVVLSVGDALVRKGWLELLDALGQLPAALGPVHLVAALARPVDEIDIRAEAAARAPGIRLTLLRDIAADRLADVYRAADLFCLPSHWEGLANAVLEAMASGLPAVTTDVAGHPEVIADGVDGLLVPAKEKGPLRDAIARLLSSPELRREIGAAARRRAEAVGDSSKAGLRLAALLDGVRSGVVNPQLLNVDPYALSPGAAHRPATCPP